MADFQYEIIEHIGVLSETSKGWRKELNKVSWNGAAPKYDIRDWAPEHEKMGKGVTLNEAELRELVSLVSEKMNNVNNTVSVEDLTSNWGNYIEKAPKSIRNYLANSHLNVVNSNTLMLCLGKGQAYKELSYRNNIECLEKYIEQLAGKYLRVEVSESSWI